MVSPGNGQNIEAYGQSVYIPAKTPGIDKKGIAVRSDGISVIKLKKFIDSSYNSIEEIFNRISGS